MIDSIALPSLLGGIAVLATASIRHIPEGQVHSMRRMGRAAPRLLMPGIHLVVPFLERLAHKISLGGRTLALPASPQTAAGTVFWQVLDPARADAVIDRAEQLIRDHVQLHGRPLAGESTRDTAVRLKTALNAQLRPRGLLVTRIDLASGETARDIRPAA